MLNRSAIALGVLLALFVGPGVAQPEQTIECEVVLTEYQARFLWGEPVENGVADYIVPLATFTVRFPEQHAGRRVRVVFVTSADDEGIPVSSEDLGERYALEVPGDYFSTQDGQIVRGRSVHLIARRGER